MCMRVLWLLCVSMFIVGSVFMQSAHAKGYYLALGDGMSSGIGSSGEFSFADDPSHEKITMVNLSREGETSRSFIGIADSIYSSQLTTAVSFLQQHQGQVKMISLQIGLNDIAPYMREEPPESTRANAALDAMITNYKVILRSLKQAMDKTSDFVILTYPAVDIKPEYRPLVRHLNRAIEKAAGIGKVTVAPATTVRGGPALSLMPDIWISAESAPPYHVHPQTPFEMFPFEFGRHFH